MLRVLFKGSLRLVSTEVNLLFMRSSAFSQSGLRVNSLCAAEFFSKNYIVLLLLICKGKNSP